MSRKEARAAGTSRPTIEYLDQPRHGRGSSTQRWRHRPARSAARGGRAESIARRYRTRPAARVPGQGRQGHAAGRQGPVRACDAVDLSADFTGSRPRIKPSCAVLATSRPSAIEDATERKPARAGTARADERIQVPVVEPHGPVKPHRVVDAGQQYVAVRSATARAAASPSQAGRIVRDVGQQAALQHRVVRGAAVRSVGTRYDAYARLRLALGHLLDRAKLERAFERPVTSPPAQACGPRCIRNDVPRSGSSSGGTTCGAGTW